MPGAIHRRLTRYPPVLPVHSVTGDESLYNSLSELEQIYDLIPSGLATLDLKLRILRINPAFAEWLGQVPMDIIGRSISDIAPALAAELAPLMLRVIHNGTSLCTATRANPSQPDTRRMTYFPLRDKKNRIQGLLLRADRMRSVIPRDVGVEEQRYHQNLAHMQRVSTVAEIASSLAHELNQPLTAILSNAQAGLRFVASDEPVLEYVRDILKDIVADDKRAGEVIQRLRVLLRKNDQEYKDVSVNAVVEDVYRILRSDAMMRRAVIQLEIAPELPLIHGDAVQLQQVLLNLMLNGLEAMADESPAQRVLVVSTRRVSARQLQISVRDAGHGLDPENPEQVFEPFFTTKPEGLGMGLAISRSIIQAHQGQLWAEANAERGATFHITLPVRTA
jgi:two-component system sensor kinase FixL